MTIGIYGKRVIGEQKAAEEKKAVQTATVIYGPRVTGQQKPAAAKPAPKAASTPPANEPPKAPPPAPPIDPAQTVTHQVDEDGDGHLTAREISVAVQANPALLDGFLKAELEHRDTPRVTVLRTLKEVESKREGGARPEILTQIDEAVAALAAG